MYVAGARIRFAPDTRICPDQSKRPDDRSAGAASSNVELPRGYLRNNGRQRYLARCPLIDSTCRQPVLGGVPEAEYRCGVGGRCEFYGEHGSIVEEVVVVVNVLVVESDSDRMSFPSLDGVLFRSCSIAEVADVVEWAEVLLFRTFEAVNLQAVWPNAVNLRWIHASSAGVDRLLDPGLRAGSWVLTNSGGVLDRAIAEYVAAGILASVKNFPQALRRQRERVWEHRVGSGVHGKSALVVGPGSIGRDIGRVLGALGMRVDAAGTSERPGDAEFTRIRRARELPSYAGEYDVIVLATPLTDGTRGLVDAEVLTAMRPDAGLVNISRGPVVDEHALCVALASRAIGWAVLDVFEIEPLPASSPLWDLDNVILTAHQSGDTDDFAKRLWRLFEQNLERYMIGSPLLNVVNKQAGYVER